jgi:hypothetical protein
MNLAVLFSVLSLCALQFLDIAAAGFKPKPMTKEEQARMQAQAKKKQKEKEQEVEFAKQNDQQKNSYAKFMDDFKMHLKKKHPNYGKYSDEAKSMVSIKFMAKSDLKL